MNGRRMYATSASSNILAMDDMDMMHSVRKDDAVSEVIGAVLLISIVVIAVSIIGVVLWSQPPPQKIPSLSVSISNSSCNVTLIHGGGDTVENTYIALLVDGIDHTNSFIKPGTGVPWTSWENGETLEYAPSYTCLLTPQRVDIVYHAGTSRTILTSGYFGDLFTTGGAARPPGAPMSPDFTGTPLAGFVPFDVQFTGTSTGSPIAWSWDFGDGGTSSDQNPLHTYSGAQSYTVSLTVHNGSGSSIKTKTNYIAGYRPLIAEFTSDTQSGIRPLAVQFTDASLGSPVSWSWVFGDGGTSTVQSPPFTYLRHGRYSVSLTVTNATTGINSTTKTNYITVNPSPPWYCGWGYRKNITIDHTKVPADQNNFPVLISFTDSNLSAQAQTSGYDILFTSSDGTTKLSHEIEAYTSGALVAWVKVPSLSSAANTTLYMYYGCATASDQQNKNGVWDTGFKGVWHLKENPSTAGAGGIKDSTANVHDGTDTGGMTSTNQVPGKIGGSLSFNNNAYYINFGDVADFDFGTSNYTASLWVKGQGTTQPFVTKSNYNGPYTGVYFYKSASQNQYVYYTGSYLLSGEDGADGIWHNLAVVREGTGANQLKLYLDGSQVATDTDARNLANDRSFMIHRWHDTASSNSDAVIDEVRMSNTARSANWIRTEYNNQNSPSTFHYITGQEEWTC